MKISTAMKEVMIAKLSGGILLKLDVEDFNKIFYKLFMYHNATKLLPYKVFKEEDTEGINNVNCEDSNIPISCKMDNSLEEYILSITQRVVSPFDKGRKLVKVLKNIQLNYGSKLPYNLCSPSSLVVLMYLYLEGIEDEIINELGIEKEKVAYLKKYYLLLLYVDRLKVRCDTDDLIVEFLERDKTNILDINVGVFANV